MDQTPQFSDLCTSWHTLKNGSGWKRAWYNKNKEWRDSAASSKWWLPHLAVFTFFWDTLGCSSAMKLHNVLSLFLSGGHKAQLIVQQEGRSLHIFIEGLPSNLLAWSLVIIFVVFLRFIHSSTEPSCVLLQNPLNSNQKQWSDTTEPWKILLNNSTLSRTATFMFCSNHQRKGYWFKCKSPFSQKECYSLLLQQYFFLKNSRLYKHSNRICFSCCQ